MYVRMCEAYYSQTRYTKSVARSALNTYLIQCGKELGPPRINANVNHKHQLFQRIHKNINFHIYICHTSCWCMLLLQSVISIYQK